jgi:hypothetical protein
MKVKLKHSVRAFKGKLDGLVYWTVKRTGHCFARKNVYPEIVDNHLHFGQINKNLANIYRQISLEYKRDLAAYTAFYKNEFVGPGDRIPTVFGFFKKMMYALGKKYPNIDLAGITIADILELELPIRNITEAMKNELLPIVNTYGELGGKL